MPRKDASAAPGSGKAGKSSSGKGKPAKAPVDDPRRLLKFAVLPVLALSMVALLGAWRSSSAGAKVHHKVLSGQSFDPFLAANPGGALVEFHVPGCMHCQKLAPDFDAASKLLAAEGGPPLASLDANAHPSIAERLNITRYPTVIWFSNGEGVQELPPTSRSTEKIVEFVKRMQEPALVEFQDRSQFDEALPELRSAMGDLGRPIVVGIGGAGAPKAVAALRQVAERMRGTAVFLHVGEGEEALEVRAVGKEASADRAFEGEVTPQRLQAWIKAMIA